MYKYDTYYRLTNVYYNYVGSLVNIVYPQTANVTYSYLNGTNMKSTMVDSTGTSAYGYDFKDRRNWHSIVSRLTSNLQHLTSRPAYSYDQMSRLDSANYPGKGTTDFQYDWVGNRLQPGNMEYNASDQLTRWPGQHRYEYDGRGNLIYEKSDTGNTQKTYAYTYSNLTSSITYSGVNRSSLMTWDAAGNRITFRSSTRANHTDIYTFVYDITAGIPAVIEETSTVGATSTTNRYIREPGGELIARAATVGTTETTLYYHFDELGSTQFLTDTNGVITDKYSYGAWGNLTSHTGTTQQPYQYVGQLGYYTHYDDTNLPLYQLGYRMYNRDIASFTQRDPIHDVWAAMSYCGGNPISHLDPKGLKWISFYNGSTRRVPARLQSNWCILDPNFWREVINPDNWVYARPGESYGQCLKRCWSDMNPWFTKWWSPAVSCVSGFLVAAGSAADTQGMAVPISILIGAGTASEISISLGIFIGGVPAAWGAGSLVGCAANCVSALYYW